ncbi:AbfB domain-containing protein [Streptomyces sp. NBC_00258]
MLGRWRRRPGPLLLVRVVPGLGGTVSLESANFPGRCIRHCTNLFRVQPISTALDRQDATYYAK